MRWRNTWTAVADRKTTASRERVWGLWADVPAWKAWDDGVEFSELRGRFQAGAHGVLKTAGGPKTKFMIAECVEFESFISRTFLPFCKMDFIHAMAAAQGGLVVTHKVVMTGFTTFLFSRVIGGKIKAALPLAVGKLVGIAENTG